MKPRVSYTEFLLTQAAADAEWMAAFEQIKAMGEHAELADGWRVVWLHEDPNWIQVGRKKERGIVRRGDVLIHTLLRLSANGNDRNSTKERT